ncbi:acyltransferase family protein [Naasia lichenicola]|uniref:acyltransferase family protein n=1 Tax=Naasia lichenicola TaxID=2565933 RepID=UPI00130E8788|nr:acyltransferase [Naasia lichenicola]
MVEVRANQVTGHGRLRLLDAMRLIAALSVVLFHYTSRVNVAWGNDAPQVLWAPLSTVTSYGLMGVDFFFLISGFVVLMSAWGADLPKFVASRVGRLYPAYWVAVILTATVLFFNRGLWIGGSWDSVRPFGVLINLTMMQEAFGVPHVDGVYWSLWAELKFYVILGVFLMVGITRQRVLLLAIAWPVVGSLLTVLGLPIVNDLLMPRYAPFFAAGMILYLIFREGWTLVSGLALLLNWTLMVRIAYVDVVQRITEQTSIPANPTVIAALFTAFIAIIALISQTRLASISWRWLTLAGSLTYPIYLLHMVIGWWAISMLYPALPKTVVLAIVLGGLFLVAYLIHRLVERPLGPILRRRVEAGLRYAPGSVTSPPRSAESVRSGTPASHPLSAAKGADLGHVLPAERAVEPTRV